MIVPTMPIYVDCAATTPLDPRVRDAMLAYFDEDFGNAGSRTHAWGQRARAAVEHARDQVAAVVGARRGDVVFTSGATESNNLAILGACSAGLQARPGSAGPGTTPHHVVSTAIEHHAVLEPLAELERRGFEVTWVRPDDTGVVDAQAVLAAVRPATLLVTVMHVNNETGTIQPIGAIADGLRNSGCLFHVDAAQSFARELTDLRHPRIDLISASSHKIQGPKGVGALIARRSTATHSIRPLMFGGGQERGLRPGTLPVPLIAGFGLAAELAVTEHEERGRRCRAFREALLEGLKPLHPSVNGDPARAVSYILNVSFPGIEAEVAIDAWADLVAISNGAACTSQSYTCSHVLSAMGLPKWRMDGALRFSWCASTPQPDWGAMISAAAPHVAEVRTP
jgi:cysteine desulfurase